MASKKIILYSNHCGKLNLGLGGIHAVKRKTCIAAFLCSLRSVVYLIDYLVILILLISFLLTLMGNVSAQTPKYTYFALKVDCPKFFSPGETFFIDIKAKKENVLVERFYNRFPQERLVEMERSAGTRPPDQRAKKRK